VIDYLLASRIERVVYEALALCECEGVCHGEYTCADHMARVVTEKILKILREVGYPPES